MKDRILVAMSGGVDSSVAALLLQQQGYEVVGVTLHLWDYPVDGPEKSRCCAPEDIHDARRVADTLGFAHYAFDRRELFLDEVVNPFVESYLSGETPSPCVRCNRGVKMRELLRLAETMGAQKIATGHYARLSSNPRALAFDANPVLEQGAPAYLYRAYDKGKDQSYFLHMLGAEVLGRLCFPLGNLDKEAVRRLAREGKLPGATKGESQELCFVPQGRYDAFVKDRAGSRLRPGPIVDETGRTLGTHDGIHGFTVGQRKNLGVATGERRYVTEVNSDDGSVHLGPRQATLSSGAALSDFAKADDVRLPTRCEVQVRYRAKPIAAELSAQGSAGARVRFEEPIAAVVRGQYAVCYAGDRVLGGGVIEMAERANSTLAPEAHA